MDAPSSYFLRFECDGMYNASVLDFSFLFELIPRWISSPNDLKPSGMILVLVLRDGSEVNINKESSA